MDELRHRYRRTPPLSLEGSREVLEEMANPPKDTPERRRMFERVRFMAALRKRMAEEELGLEELAGARP
ncbi:MAG TPA: hypothetical protein VFY65_00090 [Longimicrobium sp.]|nr:hypothetical protein [Longimicrobium sp.]